MISLVCNIELNTVLSILGTYGIVQVLAQDLGIKTGKKQRDLVQKPIVQIILLYSAAYITTTDHTHAIIVTTLYYYLKYIYSNNETSPVCFEDI